MTIIQLVMRRQHRGAEVSAANLSSSLIQLGHRVIYIGIYPPPSEALQVAGAECIDLMAKSSPFISIEALWKLVKIIRRNKPSVIQANGSDTIKYAVLARLFTHQYGILYRNISIISSWMKGSRFKTLFYKWLFGNIDHVCSVGEQSKQDFIQLFNFPIEKISVIRRGIPKLPYNKHHIRSLFCRENKIPEDAFIMMHVGNFSPEKNQDFLLKVIEKLRNNTKHIRLVFVGDGVTLGKVESKVVNLELKDWVLFLGFRKDVDQILPAADILVLSSLIEGVPGVVMEAASFGVPTVAVDIGGVGEVVQNQITGILLPNHNIDLFCDAILHLMNNTEHKEKLGENAKNWVDVEFDPIKNAKEFETLFLRLRIAHNSF